MNDATRKSIKFHYVKSHQYRVVHADGAYGGTGPTGTVHMALYSEHWPVPRLIENAIDADGSLGKELDRDGREGLIRELEVGVMMSPQTALTLAQWLIEKAAAAAGKAAALPPAESEEE